MGVGVFSIVASLCFGCAPGEVRASARASGVAMSWSSPDWRWGFADGEAHDVAMRVRSSLSTPHARADFVRRLRSADAPPKLEETKMVLALAWQRSRNLGYDSADWEAAMEEMAAGKFEGDGGPARLADAIRSRVEGPDAEAEPLGLLAARSLEALQFSSRGL